MKILLYSSLALVALFAVAGCADDHACTVSRHDSSSYDSATMSGDSKNMTGDTVTREAPPATETTTTTSTEPVNYPAIHTTGQK